MSDVGFHTCAITATYEKGPRSQLKRQAGQSTSLCAILRATAFAMDHLPHARRRSSSGLNPNTRSVLSFENAP